MDFLTGSSKNSWQPIMTADTTALSYWLNWRFLICAIWIIMSLALASFLISRKKSTGLLYDDEVWRPCLKGIHTAWLLAFRVVAFLVLLIILILNVVVDGGGLFYYYTLWTFTLITIYFGLGSVLSLSGCYQHHKKVAGNRVDTEELDAKQGTYGTSAQAENSNASNVVICLRPNEEHHVHQIAGFWGYVFQIIFQMNAGAVILTDCVFWFIIVPFLEIKDYNLNFLIINMHTTNVVFLLGDTAFNCLRFPLFQIAYFFLWTTVYVIFQWILHACLTLLIINMHTTNVVFLLGDTAFNCLRFPLFQIAYFFLWTTVYVIFQWILHACLTLVAVSVS